MNATLVSIFILCASCIFLARRVGKLEKLCVDPKMLEDLEAKRAEVAKTQKEVEEKLEHALELHVPEEYADLPWAQVEDGKGRLWCQYQKEHFVPQDAIADYNETKRILHKTHVLINEDFTGVHRAGCNHYVVKITWAKWPELSKEG
jgi:hypothetical protein